MPPTTADELQIGDARVSLSGRWCERGGKRWALTPLEANLLAHLAGQGERLVSRQELLVEVWGYHPDVESRAVASTLRRLRQKVESDPAHPRHLVSVYGHGVGLRDFSEGAPAVTAPEIAFTTRLLGREEELAKIADAIAQRTRLISIVGPGGVGKTAIAEEIARRERDRRQGGVWSCALDGASDKEGMCERLIATFGVDLSPEDSVTRIGIWLNRRGRALLFLDNVEQITEPIADAASQWLSQAPGLQILITSRERLGLPGERLVSIQPLARAPAGASPAELRGAPAVQLLLARIGAHHPEYSPTEPEIAALSAIAERLDGLPLALELAVPSCVALGPEALLERLEAGGLGLRARRGRSARHRTLTATVEWSWALLEPWEQDTLARLSVSEHALELSCAESLMALEAWPEAPPTWEVMERLFEQSMLRRETEQRPQRYRLYGAVRAFAAEQLRDEDRRAARRQLVRWWLRALDAAPLLDSRRGAAIEAFQIALSLEEIDAARKILTALWPLFLRRGPRKLASMLAEQLDRAGGLAGDPALAAQYLQSVAEQRGYEQILTEVEAIVDASPDVGIPLVVLGQTLRSLGRLPEAQQAFERALQAESGRAVAWRELGVLFADTGRYAEARSAYAEALALMLTPSTRHLRASTLMALGTLLVVDGESEAGRRCLEEAEALSIEFGDESLRGRLLNNFAVIEGDYGHWDAALELSQRAVQIQQSIGDVFAEATSMANISEWLIECGRFSEIQAPLERAMELFLQIDDQRAYAYCLVLLARLALAQGRTAVALSSGEDAVAKLRALNALPLLGYGLAALSEVRAALGDAAQARADAVEGLDLLERFVPEVAVAHTRERLSEILQGA